MDFFPSTVNVFSLPYDFLNNIFFSPSYFVVRIQYIIHIIYKICVNQLLMLSVRLLVSGRLLAVKFLGESEVTCGFITARVGVSTPNPSVVQGPTVLSLPVSLLRGSLTCL